jgi:hypothetical protein
VTTDAIGENGSAVSIVDNEVVIEYKNAIDLAANQIDEVPYTVTVIARLGEKSTETTFDLYIKNPCLDPTLFQVLGVSEIPNFDYIVMNDTDTTWSHEKFWFEAPEGMMQLCTGGMTAASVLTYELKSQHISSDYLTYDSETNTMSVFSDDRSMVTPEGEDGYQFTVNAILFGSGGRNVAQGNGYVRFVDPCAHPFFMTEKLRVEAITDGSTAVDFLFPEFEVVPAVCAEYVTYECEFVQGPYTGTKNPCSFSGGSSSGAFDTARGEYTFKSTNTELFPEGDYLFHIYAKIGDQQT